MAFSAPIDRITWDGTRGSIHYIGIVDGAAQDRADELLVDLSADLAPAPASVKILSIDLLANGDFTTLIEFDAATDQEVERIITQSDVTHQIFRDYTRGANVGLLPTNTAAAGFTGDILLTTTGMAALDEINLYIVFERSS